MLFAFLKSVGKVLEFFANSSKGEIRRCDRKKIMVDLKTFDSCTHSVKKKTTRIKSFKSEEQQASESRDIY
jgi:hypothetical protein